MARRMRLSSSKAGSVSKNTPLKGDSTFRCSGCRPMPPGGIRSKSGSVCCSANTCSPIILSTRRPLKPLSANISLIPTKRLNRSTGLTQSRDLNGNSEHIYDSLYLEEMKPVNDDKANNEKQDDGNRDDDIKHGNRRLEVSSEFPFSTFPFFLT